MTSDKPVRNFTYLALIWTLKDVVELGAVVAVSLIATLKKSVLFAGEVLSLIATLKKSVVAGGGKRFW